MNTIQWTADASGVTFTSGEKFRGIVSRVVIDPRTVAAGTLNVKLNDSHGFDLLGGSASAASASVNSQFPGVGSSDDRLGVSEQLTLVIVANSGDTGFVYVYTLF